MAPWVRAVVPGPGREQSDAGYHVRGTVSMRRPLPVPVDRPAGRLLDCGVR